MNGVLRCLIAALILLLTGCWKVGPDYVPPPLKAPAQYRFGGDETARADPEALWWRPFKDPVLDRLVDEALRHNLDLAVAVARVERYMGVYGSVRSLLLPQISGAANIARLYNAENQLGLSGGTTATGGEIDFARLGGGFEWEIDLWGQLRRNKESAEAELLAQESTRRAVLLTVVADVVLGYIELRLIDEALSITQDILKTLEDERRIASSRFREGYSSKLDLDQVESEYHRRAALIPMYERLQAEAEHALCLLLGRTPGPIVRGLDLDEIHPLAVPRGLPSDLLRRRPDLQQAEQGLIAANARIGSALGDYFPKIILTGDAGQAATQLSNLFTPGANFWALGSGLVMPIFTAGKIAGRVQAAEGATAEALADFQRKVLTALREVEDALVTRTKTQAQLEQETQRSASAESYFHLSKSRYREGYSDYLTVLDSLRQLYEARIDRVTLKAKHLSASVRLYRAMGGGWVEREDQATQPAPKEAAMFP